MSIKLIETLSDGTQTYKLDLGELGIFFMYVFDGLPDICETWEDHIQAVPGHKEI